MLNRILPEQFDNVYRGLWPAVWIFVPIVILKFFISVNVMGLNPWVSNRDVLIFADGIPLDTFGAGAAATIVWFFSVWGLAQLMLILLCILALVRYRSLVPLLYLMMLIDHIGRKAIMIANPIPRIATVLGFDINLVLLIVLSAGFILSLIPGTRMSPQKSTT